MGLLDGRSWAPEQIFVTYAHAKPTSVLLLRAVTRRPTSAANCIPHG